MNLVLLCALLFCWIGGVIMGIVIAVAIYLQFREEPEPKLLEDQ